MRGRALRPDAARRGGDRAAQAPREIRLMRLPLGLSYRRALIDAALERLAPGLGGFVVEIGAKRVPRGRWHPPLGSVRRWLRVNIDSVECPDVVADISSLPLRSGSADWIVCVEVLQ